MKLCDTNDELCSYRIPDEIIQKLFAMYAKHNPF